MALKSGWKMYSCSCSLGLGEKHVLSFVSFFNGKMFTFYICHLIWALYNLQMPGVFNVKRLFQNTEENLQLIPPNPMSTPLLQKELLQKEGVGEERFMRNIFWLLGLLREPLPGAAAPPCPQRQGQLTFDASECGSWSPPSFT